MLDGAYAADPGGTAASADSLPEDQPVYFEPLPDGGYNVVVPAMPEICTFGRTLEEERDMAKDAILCVIESAQQNGEPIPTDPASASEPIRQESLSVTA